MAEFEIGMVVKLKSGGPEMTISSLIYGKDKYGSDTDKLVSVRCQWFAGKKLEHGVFPIESLNVISEEENS